MAPTKVEVWWWCYQQAVNGWIKGDLCSPLGVDAMAANLETADRLAAIAQKRIEELQTEEKT